MQRGSLMFHLSCSLGSHGRKLRSSITRLTGQSTSSSSNRHTHRDLQVSWAFRNLVRSDRSNAQPSSPKQRKPRSSSTKNKTSAVQQQSFVLSPTNKQELECS